MKKATFFIVSLALLPSLAYAQTIQAMLKNILIFINNTLIPFILGIGFLFFVYYFISYNVLGRTVSSVGDYGKKNTKKGDRGESKAMAIYGVFAFVIIIIFWGVVNLVASSIGLQGKPAPPSDYVELNKGSSAPTPAAPAGVPPGT